MAASNMRDLLFRDEDLHPDLRPHVLTDEDLGMQVLHHELVVQVPYLPKLNAVVNQSYLAKREAIERAVNDGDLSRIIWLYERPYRLHAFVRHMDAMDDETYWSLLRDVWVDTEFPWRNMSTWKNLFAAKRPYRRSFLMMPDEFNALSNMPKRVRVYRGCELEHEADGCGISWTVRKDVAEFFARRFDRGGSVITAEVDRGDIVAYFDNRNEDEVILIDCPDWEVVTND